MIISSTITITTTITPDIIPVKLFSLPPLSCGGAREDEVSVPEEIEISVVDSLEEVDDVGSIFQVRTNKIL